MTLPGPDLGRHLVGYLEWLGARRLFWFTAYGESLADAHLLEFESLHVIAERGVYFSAGGNLIASLTTIDHANVEDPDDYRIAWQLWQEVAPLRRKLIDDCCATLASESPPLDGIDGQSWTRAAALPNRKAVPRA